MKTSVKARPDMPESRVRNDQFNPTIGLDRERSWLFEAVWYAVKMLFFLTAYPWGSSIKVTILRLFGAVVGQGVVIKPRVNIHMPWKLVIGDHAWIGEEVSILNFEPVIIGSQSCVSQRAFLCTGNHDFRDPAMSYRNEPIVICEGAWIGAQVFVGPGVNVGVDAVATAGSIVTSDLPAGMICTGNPCKPGKPRWRDSRTAPTKTRVRPNSTSEFWG